MHLSDLHDFSQQKNFSFSFVFVLFLEDNKYLSFSAHNLGRRKAQGQGCTWQKGQNFALVIKIVSYI